MPAQFTMPPDNRAVGTGNPPADVNSHTDALTAMGATFNVLNAAYAGGADPGTPSTPGADSNAALQACFNAAIAAGGTVVFPPGNYTSNSAIPITGPVRVVGLGQGTAVNENNIGAAPVPSVTINSSAGNVFTFPGQGYLWGGLEVENIAVIYTGAGAVFSVPSITNSTWRNMQIILTQSGSTAFAMSGASPSFLNNSLEHVSIITTNSVRSSPMVTIASSASGAISNTTFFRCKFTNAGYDNTQYMIYFACTGTFGGYHFADNFRDCWFEHPYGGAIKSLSGQNVTIDGCMIWDNFSTSGGATTLAAGSNGGTITGIAAWANPSPGVLSVASTATFPSTGTLNVVTSGVAAVITYTGITPTTFTGCAYVSGSGTVATGAAVTFPVSVGNSTFYIGAFAGNSGSQGTTISNCGRNRDGPNGSTTWDVYAEATSSQTLVTGFTVKPNTVSTTNNAFFNFNGHTDVTLINNLSPQGSSVNGNSTTVVTNPSPTQVTIGSGTVAAATILNGGWVAQDSGFLEWNYDPGPVINAFTVLPTVAGTVNLIRVNVRAVRSVTNVIVHLGTLGATLTSGQNFAGLYNSAGTLIGTSADQTTIWNTGGSTGIKTIALTGGPFTVQAGFVWVALLWNGTTSPAFARSQAFNGTAANNGTGLSGVRWGSASPTTQTSLPGSFTPSANGTQQNTYWAAIS